MSKQPGAYVRKVRGETQNYILELLEENGKLRRHLAALESERTRLEQERIDLKEQSLSLRTELERFEEEGLRLRQRLAKAEEENHRFSARYVEVEEQNNNLANLYVASYRLHETSNRDEVLTALQEIIINLIGSEDFVVLEKKEPTGDLSIAASFGLGAQRIKTLDLASGPIGKTARTGEMCLVDDEGNGAGEPELVACVPMNLGSRVYGVIAIFRLLDHKEGLEPLDYEIFELLASHAATSLCVSRALGQGTVGAGTTA